MGFKTTNRRQMLTCGCCSLCGPVGACLCSDDGKTWREKGDRIVFTKNKTTWKCERSALSLDESCGKVGSFNVSTLLNFEVHRPINKRFMLGSGIVVLMSLFIMDTFLNHTQLSRKRCFTTKPPNQRFFHDGLF